METKSSKLEILKELKSLKEKGVKVKIHNSILSRNANIFISGNINASNVGFNTIKSPEELSIDIYLNSTEEEIKNLIQITKSNIDFYEKSAEVTAIVDFLKDELK